jgi:hypothetical protein
MRLRVVPSTNWKRERGWRWTCRAVGAHPGGGVISGFTNEDGWTVRLRARGSNPLPPAQARAMDGARRHLIKYHRLEDQ